MTRIFHYLRGAVRVIGPLLALLAAPLGVSIGAAQEVKSADHSVLEYLGRRAQRMAAALPPIPGDRAAWEQRRAQVLETLGRTLGLPQREPMRAAVISSRLEEDLLFEDVIYHWAEDTYVSGNVVRLKDAAGPLPALVMPPGWLGELSHEAHYTPFVRHMARRGFLMLFIDDPHVGRRRAPYAGLYALASIAGTPVMGIQVFDTLRGFDYLTARPDVDRARVGVVGLCQGSEQAWLAAAVEGGFQIAVPVCGTTTYEEWSRMPVSVPVDLSDPSPYVENVLRFSDWHEIGACIAPRPVFIASNSGDNWWPEPGYNKVVSTLQQAFALYGKPEDFRHLRELRSHSLTPFIEELAPWIEAKLAASPAAASRPPQAIRAPENPDLSMVRFMQRRIDQQLAGLPTTFTNEAAWLSERENMVAWLRSACDLNTLKVGRQVPRSSQTRDGVIEERGDIPEDQDLSVPVTLIGKKGTRPIKRVVLLSHDTSQCAEEPSLRKFADALVVEGAWVCIPDHPSPHKLSRRPVKSLISLYGAGDCTGLPPLAMRVWDDIAALRFLKDNRDLAGSEIFVVGLGTGGFDAAIAAAIEPGVAGLAVVGTGTLHDWSESVAPRLGAFDRMMPYLPQMAAHVDWPLVYAGIAPRPLLLVDATDRASWPAEGFLRCRKAAGAVYGLSDREAVSCVTPVSPWGSAEVARWLGGLPPGKGPKASASR